MDDDMQTFLLNLISALFFVHLISFGICCTSFIWHTDMVTTTYFGMVLLSKEQPHCPSLSAYLLKEGAVNKRTFCQYCSIHPGNKTVNATATLTSSAVDGFGKAKHFVLINILLPTSEKPAKCSSVGVSHEQRGLKLTVNSDIIMRWRGPPAPAHPLFWNHSHSHARTHPQSPIPDPHIQTLKGHYLQYKLQYNTSLKNMRSLKTYRSSWQKQKINSLVN